MQDFEKGVSDVQSRDVIEMMMITQYFDMLKVSLSLLAVRPRMNSPMVSCLPPAAGARPWCPWICACPALTRPCAAQDVGSKNATIFIPSNPGHVGDLSAEVIIFIPVACATPIVYPS